MLVKRPTVAHRMEDFNKCCGDEIFFVRHAVFYIANGEVGKPRLRMKYVYSIHYKLFSGRGFQPLPIGTF